MEFWSYNEHFGPGEQWDAQYGKGFSQALIDMYGKEDLIIEVPDKTQFLNSLNAEGEARELDKVLAEQDILLQVIEQIRSNAGISGRPLNAMSDEDLEFQQKLYQQMLIAEKEQRMIDDPIKVLTSDWQRKYENDKRNITTFFTGQGTEDEKGILGTTIDFIQGEQGLDAYSQLVGDSVAGVASTAVDIMPEINKSNVSIAGEFLGNVPLYFWDRKYIRNAIMDPKRYPMDAGKLTLTAGAGAYTASTAYDFISNQIRAKEGLPDPRFSQDPMLVNFQSGIDAMVFTGGAAGLDAAFRASKNIARFAYGVKEGKNSGDLAKVILDRKAPFGIANVSDNSWAQWYGRVLGVFPFVGTPIRKAKATQAWWSDQQLAASLNELAPVATAMDAGVFLTKEAQDKFGTWAGLNAQFYEDFFARARALDDVIPSTGPYASQKQGYIPTFRIRSLASEVLEQQKRGKVRLQNYEEGLPDEIGGLQTASNFEKFLVNLARTPEYINAEQYRSMERQFNSLWGEYVQTVGVKDGDAIAGQAHQFKKAMKEDFNTTQEWKTFDDEVIMAQMNQVKDSLSRANENFIKMANQYDTPVAQVFKLVDQNMFAAGAVAKPGMLYADQLANQVFDTFYTRPSAMAMKDLSSIIKRNYDKPGEDAINNAARTYITKAWNDSSDVIAYNKKTGAVEKYKIQQKQFDAQTGTKTTSPDIMNVNVFNPQKLKDKLKMGTRDGDQFLEAMFAETLGRDGKKIGIKGAKAHLQQINELLDLAQIGYETKIPQTAQFVARRAVLGGVGALSGAFLASHVAFGPVGGIGLALLARHQAKILSDPQALKNLMAGMFDTNINSTMRKANMIRAARIVLGDEPDVPENLDFDDIESLTQYLLGKPYQLTKTNAGISPAPGAPQELKTFEPRFPQENPPEKGPEQIKLEEMQNSKNVSGEIKTQPVASRMSSPIRPIGGPTRGQLNPNQRAALASGNIYGAIATAKRGGIIYNKGIMSIPGRRRP